MFVYYNKEDEILAICEKPDIIELDDNIFCSEVEGQINFDTDKILFDGSKFYPKSDNIIEYQERLERNERLEDFLLRTDWYIIRKIETGKDIPPEISKMREEARKDILDNDQLAKIKAGIKIEEEQSIGGMQDFGMKRV